MKVMKFGGSSVADARRIAGAAEIVLKERKKTPIVLVLSAMKGNTDALIACAKQAERGDAAYKARIETLLAKHAEAAQALFSDSHERNAARAEIDEMFRELSSILHGIELVRECSARSLDLVMSFGERLNCMIMTRYLNASGHAAECIDTREVIVTDDTYGAAAVDYPLTYERLGKRIEACAGIPVVTGFIAATPEGITTTLGRNGSDFTASIAGAAVNAELIEIWTDVDGVLSADPRLVPDAFVIPEVSVEEAMELSYFGAKVIHPYTMIPAVEKGIPILIKNTMNPSAPGTWIVRKVKPHDREITGIASVSNAAIINVEGGGMMGVPGIASKVFTALARVRTNVIMISQASSEHSICLVLKEEESERARQSLLEALAHEISAKLIQSVEIRRNLEIIAVIGENMQGTPGLAGRVFSALGDAGINVLAIAQGSSELNISLVIESADASRALNAIHQAFLNGKRRT